MAERVLICGDRNWTNYLLIQQKLSEIILANGVEIVIEGEARGADVLGRKAAEDLGLPVLRFPAQWDTYGKSAGPIRNRQMLKEGKPTLVLAFHPYIENSKGTKDMVAAAVAAGIPTRVFSGREQRG